MIGRDSRRRVSGTRGTGSIRSRRPCREPRPRASMTARTASMTARTASDGPHREHDGPRRDTDGPQRATDDTGTDDTPEDETD